MPRPRRDLFVGELVPDKRRRGRPTVTRDGGYRDELRQAAMIMDIARAVFRGQPLGAAREATARKFARSPDTLKALWKANARAAIEQAAAEAVARRRLDAETARNRARMLLEALDTRRMRQHAARR